MHFSVHELKVSLHNYVVALFKPNLHYADIITLPYAAGVIYVSAIK